jgi:acyl carrier protein
MIDATTIDKFLNELGLLFHLNAEQMKKETRFKEDLNATSLQYMGMISIISELTGKAFSYAKMRKYKTVGDVVELLESLA